MIPFDSSTLSFTNIAYNKATSYDIVLLLLSFFDNKLGFVASLESYDGGVLNAA